MAPGSGMVMTVGGAVGIVGMVGSVGEVGTPVGIVPLPPMTPAPFIKLLLIEIPFRLRRFGFHKCSG
ncbi:hypothetical protein [Geomicrobium sp. JCM 19038]|uniref:hypothetical protein n=1 Tax=Geomicrobium sp. JCM 19038 TaxID=1460635 RepID=UPI0026F3ED8C|nr:hypothetical protein [Geomicrobium sp. JCM 19038]